MKGCCFIWAKSYCLWGPILYSCPLRSYTIYYSNRSGDFCGNHHPCKGRRRIKKNHLVHSRCSLHAPLLLSSLSPLPVDITLQAVPAAPISLVTITVAITMFQLFCRLLALCGKVALSEKSLGIQTDTLRPANLPLVHSWCFKLFRQEPELMQNVLAAGNLSCKCYTAWKMSQMLLSRSFNSYLSLLFLWPCRDILWKRAIWFPATRKSSWN